MAIGKIIPYHNNPRKNEDAIDAVAASIEEFGFQQPIVVDKDMVIIVGHTRYAAAKQLGLTKVPVVVAKDLSEEQTRAYRLADNKTNELAKWDEKLFTEEISGIEEIDMSLFGFGSIDLDEVDTEIESLNNIVEDNFDPEEIIDDHNVQLGDIWQCGSHRVMCGSSTSEEDVKKLLNGAKMDLCLTDPPYNMGYGGTGHRRNTHHEQIKKIQHSFTDNIPDFKKFMNDVYYNMVESLKDGGVFYVWYNRHGMLEINSEIKKFDVYTSSDIVWVKEKINLSGADYQPRHELCLYGWKNGAKHYFIDSRKESDVIDDVMPNFRKMDRKDLITLLESIYSDNFSTTIIREDKLRSCNLHPTMKPVKIFATMIRNSSRRGEKVIDLFGGSGTTLIACEQLGRICYTMELDPHFVEAIITRWEDLTGEKAVKLN